MAEFNELIKNFDKIRDYMRDFYVYGFKTRNDYTQKSRRTYDDERRRIESWLPGYVRWDYSTKGKQISISVDSGSTRQNPLYAAWKSKTFTKNDIMLHFYLLDILSDQKKYTLAQLASEIDARYQQLFDMQAIRLKLQEYVRQGIIVQERGSKSIAYHLSPKQLHTLSCKEAVLEMIRFFQGSAPFGYIGSTLLDQNSADNDLVRFKHHFIVHTLEDGILAQLILAAAEKKSVILTVRSTRSETEQIIEAVPLRIFASAQNGRRYLCIYQPGSRRFSNVRLDSIKNVKPGPAVSSFDVLQSQLSNILDKSWGVSFGGNNRHEQLFAKLHIDERRESYIITRLLREGRGGELLKTAPNTFLYSKTCFDCNEMHTWIKTFTGRILSFSCTNTYLETKFHRDMDRMYQMYCTEES